MTSLVVLLSSGDEDEWEDVADALIVDGGLYVVSEWITSSPKSFKVSLDEDVVTTMGDTRPAKTTTTYQLDAVYAPGMWMKVKFG
jgi:hypothetical protein